MIDFEVRLSFDRKCQQKLTFGSMAREWTDANDKHSLYRTITRIRTIHPCNVMSLGST